MIALHSVGLAVEVSPDMAGTDSVGAKLLQVCLYCFDLKQAVRHTASDDLEMSQRTDGRTCSISLAEPMSSRMRL